MNTDVKFLKVPKAGRCLVTSNGAAIATNEIADGEDGGEKRSKIAGTLTKVRNPKTSTIAQR